MLIRLRGTGPLHRQVYDAVRAGVLDGRLPPGTRLPSTRELAQELGVSRTVTVQAYERLEAEGYTEGRVGAGTFVREELSRELLLGTPSPDEPPEADPGVRPRLTAWARSNLEGANPEATSPEATNPEAGEATTRGGGDGPAPGADPVLDFRYGRADTDAFPFALWRRLVSRTARHPDVEYQDPAGFLALREALVGYLARRRGVRAVAENIVLTTGTQQALDLVSRVLVEDGDPVAIEDPHYRGTRQCLQARGARLMPVATDEEGLITDELSRCTGDIHLVCVTPSHQFPAGGVLPLGRRLELLAWAREHDAFVLEDDYDSEFRYDGPPIEAVQGLDGDGRVIYVGTFSKVLFPALRVGYLVLPGSLVQAFRAAKWTADRHSPTLEQRVLARFISDGHFESYLRRSRARYGRRREALLEALEERLGDRVRIQGTEAGIHVVVWLEGLEPEDLSGVCRQALEEGVRVYPVTPSYLGRPPGAGLVLGYAALSRGEIREGVERLARALGC